MQYLHNFEPSIIHGDIRSVSQVFRILIILLTSWQKGKRSDWCRWPCSSGRLRLGVYHRFIWLYDNENRWDMSLDCSRVDKIRRGRKQHSIVLALYGHFCICYDHHRGLFSSSISFACYIPRNDRSLVGLYRETSLLRQEKRWGCPVRNSGWSAPKSSCLYQRAHAPRCADPSLLGPIPRGKTFGWRDLPSTWRHIVSLIGSCIYEAGTQCHML